MRPLLRQFRCRRTLLPAFIISLVFILYVLFSQVKYDELQPPAVRSDATLKEGPKFIQPHPPQPPLIPEEAHQIQPPKDVPLPPERQEYQDRQVDVPKVDDSARLQPPFPGAAQSQSSVVTREEYQGGQPADPEVARMRNEVRQITKEAWDAYVQYAWGSNELKPISKQGHQPEVLGSIAMGATIIDGMDTLLIMGLNEEFQKARDYVANSLNFDQPTVVSVFEYTIRYLGGLLSAYSFTLDEVFLKQAVKLADRLLPAFNSSTGIPYSLINLHNGFTKQFTWSIDRCSILSEMGTMHMEFTFLSELTGDPKYAQRVSVVRDILSKLPRDNGLFYNHVNPRTGNWCGRHAGLSGLADSFYEYLLKEWIRTDHADTQARQLYDQGIGALLSNGVFKQSPAGNLYVGSYHMGSVSSVMDHLACFSGGMLALGSSGPRDAWFDRGVKLTNTCRLSYENTATHLGPDSFEFGQNLEAVPIKKGHKVYLLRPETVESYFYLWRFTKNPVYRQWAWDIVQALKTHTRTGNGYSGLINVNSLENNWDDVQQSYFIAETLKYLYLIFSDDSLLPLDRWVFNSEAHPLPVHYRVRLGNTNWPKPNAQIRNPVHT